MFIICFVYKYIEKKVSVRTVIRKILIKKLRVKYSYDTTLFITLIHKNTEGLGDNKENLL